MSDVDQAADTHEAADSREKTQRAFALAAAILLGIAAVLTAWSAYRASLTGDIVIKSYSEQQALISQANDTYGRSDQQESMENQLFLQWAVATANGNTDAADYLMTVMGDGLLSAVQWWSEQPEETIPSTPFVEENPNLADLPSAQLVAEGDALMDESELKRAAAEEADAVSDRFDLAQVFFAVVLFVAGLTTLIQRRSIQAGFLILSILGLIGGLVVLATTPGWSSLS